MPEPIKKEARVEMAQKPPEKTKEPEKKAKEKVREGEMPNWNFPLQQRSVRAKNLREAIKKVNTKE